MNDGYTLHTAVKGHFMGERVDVIKLPKRKRKVSKATVTIPRPGNVRVISTVKGTNNAGNNLKDTKQSKLGPLASVMFDGTNTTPEDVTSPVASGPLSSDYHKFEFTPTEKQLRVGHKYGHNKSKK